MAATATVTPTTPTQPLAARRIPSAKSRTKDTDFVCTLAVTREIATIALDSHPEILKNLQSIGRDLLTRPADFMVVSHALSMQKPDLATVLRDTLDMWIARTPAEQRTYGMIGSVLGEYDVSMFEKLQQPIIKTRMRQLAGQRPKLLPIPTVRRISKAFPVPNPGGGRSRSGAATGTNSGMGSPIRVGDFVFRSRVHLVIYCLVYILASLLALVVLLLVLNAICDRLAEKPTTNETHDDNNGVDPDYDETNPRPVVSGTDGIHAHCPLPPVCVEMESQASPSIPALVFLLISELWTAIFAISWPVFILAFLLFAVILQTLSHLQQRYHPFVRGITVPTSAPSISPQQQPPLGFLYTQFPGKPDPVVVWPATCPQQWMDVTEEYSNLLRLPSTARSTVTCTAEDGININPIIIVNEQAFRRIVAELEEGMGWNRNKALAALEKTMFQSLFLDKITGPASHQIVAPAQSHPISSTIEANSNVQGGIMDASVSQNLSPMVKVWEKID